MNPMRWVCFDVGGVLVEINHNWKGAMLDAELSEEVAERFDHPLVELAAFNEFQRGVICFSDYCVALGAHLGGIDPDAAQKVHTAILRVAYPGIPELIRDLHAEGIRTGCLSNTNAPHWEAFFAEPRLAALREISLPMASHLIGAEKPDPAMYRAFEAASGASGEQIVYFDDGLGNVESARSLGWRAFQVDPQGDTAAQMRTVLQDQGWLPPAVA